MFLSVPFWDLFAEIAMKMVSNGKMSIGEYSKWGVFGYVLDIKISHSLYHLALGPKHGFGRVYTVISYWVKFAVVVGWKC